MVKIKSNRVSGLFVVVGLTILSFFLGACQNSSDSTTPLIGLRTTETESVAEMASAEVSELTAPTNAPLQDSLVEETTSLESTGVSVELIDNNSQARIADRSAHIFDPKTATELTAVEMEGLIYMREEEKLARDVYLALYELWGMPLFQNIAGSEQAHMDSILVLIDQYGLTDPAAVVGEFTDPFFQSLYNNLVNRGSLSLADADIVGATIEELDIIDLQERLAQTNNEYIIQVYTNLLAGSENHLRAFVSNLERQTGEVYQPAYIDDATYQAIITGAGGQGNGYGRSGGGNSENGNGNGNGRRNGQVGGA